MFFSGPFFMGFHRFENNKGTVALCVFSFAKHEIYGTHDKSIKLFISSLISSKKNNSYSMNLVNGLVQ
jgi:hypothetical protein